jgi:quercetin dioxygenase-like cupin family protein
VTAWRGLTAREIEPPADGALSRTLHKDERLKAVLFGLSAGQELPEHNSSTPAVIHSLRGEATVTLGDDQTEVGAGAWIHMMAGLRHSIRTQAWCLRDARPYPQLPELAARAALLVASFRRPVEVARGQEKSDCSQFVPHPAHEIYDSGVGRDARCCRPVG